MQELDDALTKRANDLYNMIYWCDRSAAYTRGAGGRSAVEKMRAELRQILATAKVRDPYWEAPAEVGAICKS